MYCVDESEKHLLNKIIRIADEVIGPNAEETDVTGAFPRSSIDALAGVGALGLNVPESHGGWGGDMRLACGALDIIAQRCASTAMIYLMHLCGIACYAARPEATEKELKAAARGDHLSTLAWSEKGSRSHFWAPMSEVVESSDGFTLSAEKSWVTSAGYADGYVVSAKVPNASGPTETLLAYVPKDAAGFTVGGPWNSLGLRGNASAPMNMKDVEISEDRLLCDKGAGFPQMMAILPWFALGNAAISIGIAEAATQSTTGHLIGHSFQHLSSPLAELPNLRERLARMRLATDRARAHLYCNLRSVETGDPMAQVYVLESKPSASQAAMEVTDLAMAACGGAAFSKHLSVERNFRDSRAASVMAPTSDVLYDFIGKALCGMPLF
ncbi:MAG: acyl-CoA dehydrogenase family protein [Armatimonas sp.]